MTENKHPLAGLVAKLLWDDGNFASTPVGLSYYTVWLGDGEWTWGCTEYPYGCDSDDMFTDEEAAKAAAQADYERRIFSAIDPDALNALIAATLERARKEIASRRALLNRQFEALDITREDAVFAICEEIIADLVIDEKETEHGSSASRSAGRQHR